MDGGQVPDEPWGKKELCEATMLRSLSLKLSSGVARLETDQGSGDGSHERSVSIRRVSIDQIR